MDTGVFGMAKVAKRKKIELPPDFDLGEYFAQIGRRGGKANTQKQMAHRKYTAVRAMLHKKWPNDPRWR